MIVSDRLRLIFVHVPKTGGHAVRAALREASDDFRIVGPWHLPAMTGRAMLPYWREYTSLAFVRNPWERLVSAYAFVSRPMSFDEFTRSSVWPDMLRPQRAWLLDSDGSCIVNVVGRYENFDADFRQVCVQPMKRVNASVHRPYQEYYTDETKERVATLFADDIVAFDYHF